MTTVELPAVCDRMAERGICGLQHDFETERDQLHQIVVATATDARILVKALAEGSTDAAVGLAERIYDRHERWDVGEEEHP